MVPCRTRPGRPKISGQETRQRFGHFPELGKDEGLFLPRRDLFADLRQPGELAAVFRSELPVAEQLTGVIAQLLESHQIGQHQASPLHPVQALQGAGHLVDQLGVNRRLPLAKTAKRPNFRLVGQIGDDPLVRLHPPKNVRLNQPPQRCITLLLAGIEHLDEILELVLRAQQTRAEEIEQRPEVRQPVFDRRARQGDPRLGLEPLDRFGLPRRRVLDGLRLVDHGQLPGDVQQPRLPLEHRIGREHHVRVLQRRLRLFGHPREFVFGRLGRVDELAAQRRREPLHFGFPVGQQRRRYDQQRRFGARLLFQHHQQGQDLNRLAESHVVGQALRPAPAATGTRASRHPFPGTCGASP